MDFTALRHYMDRLVKLGIPGCDIAVWKDHKPVFRYFTGERAPGVAMNGNENYWLYSTTKLFTMVSAMQLIERGQIALTDPVSKYLPAYANLTVRDGDTVRPARTVMTIEHLMAMQGGLDYDVRRPATVACIEKYGDSVTTRQIVDSFAADPLLFDPGTHFNYSLCHDVMAAVIEVVSGMTFAEYVRKNILDPLDIRSLTFHPTETQLDNVAQRYHWDEAEQPVAEDSRSVMPYSFAPLYESGGAGLMGNVEGYIPFADALANGGVGFNGSRILTAESIDILRTERQFGDCRKDFDAQRRIGYNYALGVRTLVDDRYVDAPIGEFGWDGAAGAYVMMDPKNHLSVFFAMHVMNCGRCYHDFHFALRDLVYHALELA